MRLSLVHVVLVLVGGMCLAGCGGSDDADGAATEPTVAAGSSTSPSATSVDPTPSRADVEQTCVDLYHPPAQLVPRAIVFVQGSSTGDPVAEADEIVSGLSTVAGTADPTLAADIAIVRIAVDTQRAVAQSGTETAQDLTSFNASTRRLAQACAPYGE